MEKDKDYNAVFEALAQEFYERTGMLAPGKDMPFGYDERLERLTAWNEFLLMKREIEKTNAVR